MQIIKLDSDDFNNLDTKLTENRNIQLISIVVRSSCNSHRFLRGMYVFIVTDMGYGRTGAVP